MKPARAMTEPCVDPNNLTAPLATILRESFGIEPKGKGCVYQKSYPDYYSQLPYPRGYRVFEFLKFSGKDGKIILEHVGQFILQCSEASANDALKLKKNHHRCLALLLLYLLHWLLILFQVGLN
jgi:hypothetical protein